MKDIKDILENYSESPSEDVWKRLSARLDEEMPVQGHHVSAWKWAAGVLAILAVGGGIIYGVLRHSSSNQDVAKTDKVENVAVEETTAVETEPIVTAQVENVATVEKSEKSDASNEPVVTERVAPIATETVPVASKKEEVQSNSVPKTNIRQEVLPANSTLAKQLAADPVLKNLSDESVDWSLPTHLSIPNLFTPNNDGVNDFFVIEGLENYASPKLVVRDKNNKVVYQSNAYKNTWGGDNCPDGVYTYEITFVYNGIENQAAGKVRIMRS